MENRKLVRTIRFALAFVALLNLINLTIARQVYAYEIGTHMGITKEIVRFYNANFSQRSIGATEIDAMIQGSKDEDDAPRWMNHFYDPMHNRGLTNFFGTNWMSSKQWANNSGEQISALYNPIHQVTYSAVLTLAHPELLTQTDYTWRRSLEDYARGDTARAFRGLGHVLHLLEDASVPDHTRNDPHPAVGEKDYLETGSPYELWTARFNEKNINLLQYLYTKKPIALDSRDAYFDAMAKYSNNNFYSKDTIDVVEYAEPKPDYVLRSGKQVYGYKRDVDGDFRLVAFNADIPELEWVHPTRKSASLKDGQGDQILRDYWERLAPKAVQYGAGLVDLFLKEAEQLKNDPSFSKEKPKSPLAEVLNALRGFFERASEDAVSDGLYEVAAIPLRDASVSDRIPGQARNDSASAQVRNDSSSVQGRNDSGGMAANSAQGRNDSRDVTVTQEALPQKQTESKSSAAPKQLAQAKIPTPPAPEYRPNLAPPKPARFANAVGGENNVSTNAVSVPTPCVYATTAAPSRAKLMLNEIAWMGSAADANDEWMELKNISGGELNVSGWQLVDAGDQIHITFPEQTMIPAGGLFLLERTDDDTVSTIPADYIYVGALGNTNDGVRMFDANCLLQDEVPGDPWPAGEVGTKRTMERAIDFFWYTSSGTGPSGILGTPRMENSTRQAAQINLSRAGLGSAPPIPEPAPAVAASSGATHVVISEIHAGTDGGSDNEFIELYNPTDTEVDLTGWSLKKKSSTGNESALVAASRLSGKRIGAKSFFLLGNDGGYTGSVAVDASWARSNTIAYENNSVVLYNVSDENVDEVHWAEIVKGQSVERKAVDGGICASASGAGAYLGNGCDTNADADMESRASPEPQNGASLPEPRTSLSITNFNVNYDKATQRVALSWDGATDARGATSSVRYIIEDVSDAATTTSVFSGTATTSYVYRVTDIGRDYAYRVAATDAGGLTGEASRATTTATSPITTLKFFTNPNTGATDARIFLTFDSYPLLTQRTGMSTWQILVFSLNADPVRQASLDTAAAWTPNDQADLLSVRYRNYSGWMTRYSLILPDDATRVGSSGGIDNSAMRWSDIEIGKFMIRHEVPPRPFTSADYVMVSIYDFAGSGGGNQWFRFAAADKTKYYFSDVAPVTAPPTPPASALVERYDAGLSKAVIGWDPSSTDSDGMNREIGYEVNRATSTAVERFPDNEWVRFTQGVAGANSPDFKYTYSFATSSNTYVFGVRAVDEFGYVSSVATTAPYTVP